MLRAPKWAPLALKSYIANYLEDCQILKQRYYTNNDYNNLSDLFYLTIQRQHIDKIKNEKDNQNRYQKAD